jgi:hypothetical protein
MDEDMLNALIASIDKWEAIIAGTAGDGGSLDCALCQLYRNPESVAWEDACLACPVAIETQAVGCSGSPYHSWLNHHKASHGRFMSTRLAEPGCAECLSLATEMRDFLLLLLPEKLT